MKFFKPITIDSIKCFEINEPITMKFQFFLKFMRIYLPITFPGVFGCVAFALIPYERRVNLDEKSIRCVMFSVSKES